MHGWIRWWWWWEILWKRDHHHHHHNWFEWMKNDTAMILFDLFFSLSLYFLSSLVDFIHQVSSLSSGFFEWMKDDEDDDDEDHCSTSSSMIMVRRITLLRFTSQIFFSSSSIIINRQKILDFFHFQNKRRIFLEFFLWPFFQNSIIRNSCWNPKDSIRRRFKFPLELTWLKKMIR